MILARLCLATMILLATPLAALAERVALVIGMGSYQHVVQLKNTLNDANNIARKLQDVGFTVTLATDKTQGQLLDIMQAFSFQAETADLALVYYAGHGVEVDGVNYLIPVDAQVNVKTDIARVGISLNALLKTVEAARKLRVVILDSCRNNPFIGIAGISARGDTSLSGNTADPNAAPQGLAAVNPELGTLVAYAAKAGQVALDGTGSDSPYATALIDAFGRKDVEIGLMFRQVRDEVLSQTHNLQEPYQYGSLSSTPFYLAGASAGGVDLATEADAKVAWSNVKPDQESTMLAMADSGDTRSMIGLALMRLNPKEQRYNPAEAVQYFTKAAAAGAPDAQFELAKLYEQGLGVAADPARALELYQAAAAQGFPDAVNDLGFLYYQGGLGLPPDHAKGLDLFRQAADLRHPEAMFNYARMIDLGQIKGKGPADAARYLYQSVRIGANVVIEQMTTNADSFTKKTRIEVQKILKEHQFFDGKTDGKFGPGTVAAINLAAGLKG